MSNPNPKPPLSYQYRWTHIQTGKTGVRTWEGFSRFDFLDDLNKWNSGHVCAFNTWKYEEV